VSEELINFVFRTAQSTPVVGKVNSIYQSRRRKSQKTGPFISTATRTSDLDPRLRLYFTDIIKLRSLYYCVLRKCGLFSMTGIKLHGFPPPSHTCGVPSRYLKYEQLRQEQSSKCTSLPVLNTHVIRTNFP
jgi:hypothetical protein